MGSNFLLKSVVDLICFTILLIALAAPAYAYRDNSPEEAQSDTEQNYLRKLNNICGTDLTINYDAKSLSEYNLDIRREQTGGHQVCNEPLRYIWYMCKTAAGKEAVQAARLSKIICKGTSAKTGSLAMEGGTITVERAFDEDKPYVRSRKQFEALFNTRLKLASEDPYHDEQWHKLKFEPNPVTDTKTYCLVNGIKAEWTSHNQDAADPFVRRKQDATVKCWKDGELITSVDVRKGLKTGFETYFGADFTKRSNYLNGKQDGEQKTGKDGRTSCVTMFANGKEQWKTEYYPNGKISRHHMKSGESISFGKKGDLQNLHCSPKACDDNVLRNWCGCNAEVTHTIYNGRDEVSKVVTYKNGELQSQNRGAGEYGSDNEVSYKKGKKHGEEQIYGKAGKLSQTISWNHGVKDGKELKYSEDGKRIVRETVWAAGEKQRITEFYLNGNPKSLITVGPAKLDVKTFWDTGKLKGEGNLLSCKSTYSKWCREGVEKEYYESGSVKSETNWKSDKQHGTTKNWWENGRLSKIEEYEAGVLTNRKTWDKEGNLTLDEKYESDGSRKLKR